MKKPLIPIIGCALFSVAIVIVLYLRSDDLIHRHNSFYRIFPPHPITEANILDIRYNSYYIAGATTDHFYLGNTTAPLHLLATNTMLTDTQHIRLSIENIQNLKLRSLRLTIDSPYFYLMDGIMPGLFRGRLNNWHAGRFMYDSVYFTQSVPITPSSFALRSLSSRTREYELGKEMADPPHIKFAPDLLQKQVDGIFCTDGMLHYNKKLARLIYVYFYRNEYILMDTSLNLDYRGHTIDTISQAQIKVASIASENSRTLAAPALMVNKQSCVSGNFLFVHSNLLAKNESKELFDRAAVIDVYHLKTGTYKFSFYLFDRGKMKMRDFRVFDNQLIALFDHYIVTYELSAQHLKPA